MQAKEILKKTNQTSLMRRILILMMALVIGGSGLGAAPLGSDMTAQAATLSKTAQIKKNQNKVIKTAKSKLGKPYVWGAQGPNRFDCSGYVYWVMKNSGVKENKFSRTTAQGIYNKFKKYNVGKKWSKAKKGDVILFGTGGSKRSIYHVAIYYGNGKILHASSSQHKVVIAKGKWVGKVAAIVRLPGLR